MSTSTGGHRVAVDMFARMTEQDREVYLASMINDNEDLTEMDYELEATTAFEVGTTSDPNPSKNKNKRKMAKEIGKIVSND
ncbi:hypothetical protein D1007_30259 [Hordeum vulgare]|nr:hypothetical protein D1007_30259 [Hordeum vulgare]